MFDVELTKKMIKHLQDEAQERRERLDKVHPDCISNVLLRKTIKKIDKCIEALKETVCI